MKAYTVQMARWRKVKEMGIPFLDTTVKSGVRVFAPSWAMVSAWKDGRYSEETYKALYRRRMRRSMTEVPEAWERVLKAPQVALACYCKAGCFCHRHLLVDLFEELAKEKNIPFERGGEIEGPNYEPVR